MAIGPVPLTAGTAMHLTEPNDVPTGRIFYTGTVYDALSRSYEYDYDSGQMVVVHDWQEVGSDDDMRELASGNWHGHIDWDYNDDSNEVNIKGEAQGEVYRWSEEEGEVAHVEDTDIFPLDVWDT